MKTKKDLIDRLGVADMWLWYDTSPEAGDLRKRFRQAATRVRNDQYGEDVRTAVNEADFVLACADPVWLKTFGLGDL